MNLIITLTAVLLLLGVIAKSAQACTTVIVGRRASATGTVLVGHNEDEPGRFVMQTHIIEPHHHADGSVVSFEPNRAKLPLPELQSRLLWSEARTAKGTSFADLYYNENGVFVCSNCCAESREEDSPNLNLVDGGISYGIRRIVAESAKTARDAVDIAVGLIEKFGYAASGRSYHFIDSGEAWVLQVVRGRHYAIKRVPDDEVYVIPNHFTIHEPTPDTPGLQELMDYAKTRGWWDDANTKFDFARAYQAPESRGTIENMHRHVRALEVLLEQDLRYLFDRPEELPFSVKPARPVSVDTIKKILRTHYENTSSYVPRAESGTPHFMMETRPICDAKTLESSILEMRSSPELTIWRRALGQPCLSVYLPWYFGITSIPDGYEDIDSETALATHFPVSNSISDITDAQRAAYFDWRDNIWFETGILQGAIDLLYSNIEVHEQARARLNLIETNIERELKMLDTQIGIRLRTDPDISRAMMQGAVNAWAVSVRVGIQSLIERLGIFEAEPVSLTKTGKGEIRLKAHVEDRAKDTAFAVKITNSRALARIKIDTLDTAHCICGPRYIEPSKWSQAADLSRDDNGLKLVFKGGEWLNDPELIPCLTDLMILLVNSQGKRNVMFVKMPVRIDN